MGIPTDTDRGSSTGRAAIRELVTTLGAKDPEIEAYAEQGSWRQVEAGAVDIEAIEELAGAIGRTPKRCYQNAREVVAAAGRDGVRYVEGIAVPAVAPVPTKHAWVEIDGVTVEVTWNQQGAAEPGTAYYGVAMELDAVLEAVDERGTSGPVIMELDR